MKLIAIGLILFIPVALVCGGLLLGLNALKLPPAIALIGLANAYPKEGTPLASMALISRPLAVVGVIVALLQ